jgi:hypothetical protein
MISHLLQKAYLRPLLRSDLEFSRRVLMKSAIPTTKSIVQSVAVFVKSDMGMIGAKREGPQRDFINGYVATVHRTTRHDPVVLKAFLRVMNLMQPPTSVFHPKRMVRVLGGRCKAVPQVQLEMAEVRG